MSTAFAFQDDGLLVEGPTVARAFLHALARKLHRLALVAKETTTRVLHGLRAIPRLVLDTTLTTVSTVRSRSGFSAAVSLILTGGQVIAYALHALVSRTRGFAQMALARARHLTASLPTHRFPRDIATRALELAKKPVVAGVILAVAVVMAGTVAAWRWARGRVDQPLADLVTLAEDDLERIMKGLYVALRADGSVHVHGIPVTITDDVRDGVARVAAQAATQRLESLVRRARPLSTLDLQAVNVAARSAVARQFANAADTAPVLVQAG